MRIRPCSSSIPPPLCVCASWDVCGAASLGTSPHLTMWRSPCLQVNGSADKQGPKQAKHVRRPVVLFITGVPGSGKTTFVKEQIFCVTDRDGPVDLVRWPLRKEGTVTQVVWHESVDGHIAVAGGYSWPNDSVWPKHRRGTTPALGGTDTLQPQSAGLLAALLRGELGSPRVVCMEACTMAKAGGKLVQEAMLHAPRVLVLELCVSRAEAVARIRSRDGPWSGKKRMTPEEKYDTYAREVTELHERMDARACVLDVKVEWMRGSASELRGVCRELLASGVLG